MNLVHLLTFLHITFVVLALGMMVFPGILLQQIASSGDVAAIRTAFRIGMYHGPAGFVLLGIGALFGLAAAVIAHFSLQSGWLSAAYAAVVLLVFFGVAVHRRHEASIYAAASSGRNDAGETCIKLARSPVQSMTNAISGFIWLFAIYDMVTKPF
jgi:hypothetical protein